LSIIPITSTVCGVFMAEQFLCGLITWTSDKASAYMQFLWRALKWFTVLAAALLILLVAGVLFRLSWLIGFVMLVLSISTIALLLLCLPLGTLATMAAQRVFAVKLYLQIVGGMLIWLLLLTFYFSVLPISNNPGAIVIMILLFSIMALVGAIYGIGIDPKKIYISVGVVFVLTTISFSLPKTFSELFSMRGRLDEILSECIKNPSSCQNNFETKEYSSFEFNIRLVSVEKLGQDFKYNFLLKHNISLPGAYSIDSRRSYMNDDFGNRYKIKSESLAGGTAELVRGAEQTIWVRFGNIHPDSSRATIVLSIDMTDVVFNNIKLPK
jgi:hypothetical protein